MPEHSPAICSADTCVKIKTLYAYWNNPLKINAPIQKLDARFQSASTQSKAQQRLYVISDVHGHAEELDHILKQIKADIRKYPNAEFQIVIDGDMVDRGPHSKSVLERLAELKANATLKCQIIILKGNHEIHLMHFLSPMKTEKDFKSCVKFLSEGGAATLASYGVFLIPNKKPSSGHKYKWLSQDDVIEAQKKLNEAMPAHHKALLRVAQIEHYYKPEGLEKGFYICHGGVAPSMSLSSQTKETRLGIDYKDKLSRAFAKYQGTALRDDEGQEWVVIHGHTMIGKTPQITPGRISIDTGCFKGGNLSCAVIVDGEYETTYQCASLYAPYNPDMVPKKDNWPPKRSDEKTVFDKLLSVLRLQ